MERKSSYNKGRQGHPRNVHSVSYSRHHFLKKFRLPLTAVFALMFVFGVAPIVGEHIESSVLTAPGFVQEVEGDASTLPASAVSACKDELSTVTGALVAVQEELQEFAQKHAVDFSGSNLQTRANSVTEAAAALVSFVHVCASR